MATEQEDMGVSGEGFCCDRSIPGSTVFTVFVPLLEFLT